MAYKFYDVLPTEEVKVVIDHFRGANTASGVELFRCAVAAQSYAGNLLSKMGPPLIGAKSMDAGIAGALDDATLANLMEVALLKTDAKAIPAWLIPILLEVARRILDRWLNK